MTTFVVPDTNVLYSDPFLEGPQLSTVLSAEETADVRLLLPAVVVDELRNKLEQRIVCLEKEDQKVYREFARLSGTQIDELHFRVTPDDKQSILDRFDRRMQQFRAQQRILGYPSASPEELARRSIEAAPPFKGEDRGLRDTLIWLCVKEFLKSTDFTDITVVLVTKDKAFYDSNERVALSTHLVRELENAGIPRDSVIAKTDIQAVIDDPISSMLSTVQGIKKKIKRGEIEGFAADDHLISNAANDWLLGHANLFHSILSNYPIMGFSLLYETSLENVTQVLALGDGKVSASSVWVGELFPIVDELREIEDFGRYGIDCPRVSIEFTVSSLLGKAKCRWFVETHEVVRMNIKVDGVALN